VPKLWERWAKYSALGNGSQGPLSTNKEVLQIIASVVFPQVPHIIKNRAVGEHYLESHAVRMKRIVLDEMNSTSVGGQVSSNLA
jgi:hypothetical protein